jgi:hypothetical protein
LRQENADLLIEGALPPQIEPFADVANAGTLGKNMLP